ncbi:MAG: hypothetical protein AB7N76_28220 [Planctomycetota bacterium]
MKPFAKVFVCGCVLLGATFAGSSVAQGDPPYRNRIPRLNDPVIYDTEFCTYADLKEDSKVEDLKSTPIVQNVNWDHPLIKAALPAIEGVSRSTMSYGDHLLLYALDEDNDWGNQKGLYNYWMNKPDSPERTSQLDRIDAKVARGNYENFVKTLLGECRDYPYMVKKKLEVLAHHTPVNKAGKQGQVVDPQYPFDSLTGEGYSRLRYFMSDVFSRREAALNPNNSRFNYAWNEVGHTCNRVDNSVKPWTHGEIRYMFEEWLAGDAKPYSYEKYEEGLKKFLAEKCDKSPNGPDLGYSYDFRGHKNFKANWFECNSFIWNSRDAARMIQAQLKKSNLKADLTYIQHPFAVRYLRTKELMAAYLFYPGEDHKHMRRASESGGGPHLYVHNEDANRDGVAEYRLFPDVQGSGDIGLGSQALDDDVVDKGNVTDRAVKGHRASNMRLKDWGFNKVFNVTDSTRGDFEVDQVFSANDSNSEATFKLRMARMNQALDRHTNWGPTMMFSPLAYKIASRYSIRGAYSPIVAMSYEISKSNSFAMGNYPDTHPKDQNKVKYMFIVRFPTKNYFDERDMRAGRRPYWDDMYFNESSLSNDYYHERALDKFGWIPADDISSAAYLAEADGEDSYYPPSVQPGISSHFNWGN